MYIMSGSWNYDVMIEVKRGLPDTLASIEEVTEAGDLGILSEVSILHLLLGELTNLEMLHTRNLLKVETCQYSDDGHLACT